MKGATSIGDLTAVVLAGGAGTRLRPVVPDLPKVLAPVCGRPFVSYVLDGLAAAGLRDVVLATGWRAEQVRRALGERWGRLRLRYSCETEPLGTGGALRLSVAQGASDPVLVLNGDSLCAVSLDGLWRWHRAHGAPGTLVLVEVQQTGRYGRVEVGKNFRIRSFVEKAGCAGPGWVSAGVYLLAEELVATIPRGKPASLEAEMLPRWVEGGLYGYTTRAAFLDIGTADAFARAERFVCETRHGPTGVIGDGH